jgi:AbrB family looped-hinge helix DNA binding protein
MAAVKIGTSRQVVIPKKLYDQLGLRPGDYLEVELGDGTIVMTPKQLVEKAIAEGLEDLRRGRSIGPFKTAKAAARALDRAAKVVKRGKK